MRSMCASAEPSTKRSEMGRSGREGAESWLSIATTALLIVTIFPLIYCFIVAMMVDAGVQAGKDKSFIRLVGSKHAALCCRLSQRALDLMCGAYGAVMDGKANERNILLDQLVANDTSLGCLGDSEFALWMSLEADLEAVGLRAFNAGFGGSTFKMVENHAMRLCFARSPARVLLHCGGNDYDLRGRRALEDAVATICRIAKLGRAHNCKVYYLAGPRKPSYTDDKWAYCLEIVDRVRKESDSGLAGIVDLSGEEHGPCHVDGVHLAPSARPAFARAIASALEKS